MNLIRKFLFLFFLVAIDLQSEEVWIDGVKDYLVEKVLVEKLQGLIFVQSLKDEFSLLNEAVHGVTILDAYVPNEKVFYQEMNSFIGKPLSFVLIKQIKQKVANYYQERGFLVVSVLVPEGQDITEGILQVIIQIGRLGKVHAEGAYYFSNEKLASKIRTQKGEYIQKDRLLSDLNWMNENPFRTSSIVLEKGKEFGETDVTLSTEDRRPLRIFGGYENTGNQIAGSSRFLTGVNLGNLFGIDHQLNYLFKFSSHFNEWWGHSGSYIAPLPWRHIFEAYGFFTHAEPNVAVGFNSNGKSWQLAGRYKIPFQTEFLNHVVFIGYEFQRSNNFLAFEETLLFDRYIDVSQFLVGYEVFLEYQHGKTKIGAEVYLSPGKMTEFNTDSAFAQERPGTESNYIYGKTRLEQSIYLPKGFLWWLDILFQQATGKLLPTEQFSLGGFYTVRGYDENEVISDNGISIKNELYFPVIKIPPRNKYHQFKILGFIDYGWGYDVNQNILSKDVVPLASVGIGFRYHFEKCISARFDYGWQLNTVQRIVDPSNKKSRAHMSVIISY